MCHITFSWWINLYDSQVLLWKTVGPTLYIHLFILCTFFVAFFFILKINNIFNVFNVPLLKVSCFWLYRFSFTCVLIFNTWKNKIECKQLMAICVKTCHEGETFLHWGIKEHSKFYYLTFAALAAQAVESPKLPFLGCYLLLILMQM